MSTVEMLTVQITLVVRSDCVEYLDATPGESRERNLADMLDAGQATIVHVRRAVNLADANDMWKQHD